MAARRGQPLDRLDVQLAQLSRIDRRWRVAHQVHSLRGLREWNDLANRGLPRQQRADAVESERQTAVRRRPVFERFEEEAKTVLRILLGEAKQAEHLGLRLS